MSQQYEKNTDVPNQDSFLWTLGNGWKISQKTGDAYAPIDTIEEPVLGTALTTISESGQIDVIDFEGYFFVPNKFVSKFTDKKTGQPIEKISWSVFAFENRVKADKKLADVKKFASFTPKTTGTTATVPQPIPQGQRTFSSKPVTASTSTPTQSTILTAHDRINNLESANKTITTFTDPTPVKHDDKELIATMLSDGFVFLPSSIAERNCWDRAIYDDENNIIGTQLVFLMGRIINVEIPDNNQ